MFELLRTHPRSSRSIRRPHPGRRDFEPEATDVDCEWQSPPVNVNLPGDFRCKRREFCEFFDPKSDEYRPAFQREEKCSHFHCGDLPDGRMLQKDVLSPGQIIWDDIGEGVVAESLSWCQNDKEKAAQSWSRKPEKPESKCRSNAAWYESKVNNFDDLNDVYLPRRPGSVGHRDEKCKYLRKTRGETGSLPNCNKHHGDYFLDKRGFRKTKCESAGTLKRSPYTMDATEILPMPLGDNLRFGRSGENSGHTCSHSYSSFKQDDSGLYPTDIPRQEVNSFRQQGNATSTMSPSSGGVYYLSSKHWLGIILIVLFGGAVGVALPYALRIQEGSTLNDRLALATSLLKQVPLIDGHNDLPWNIRKFLHNRLKDFNFREDLRQIKPWSSSAWSHTDLPRLRAGHVSAQFWSAYVPCEAQHKDAVQLAFEQIDVIRRLTEKFHPDLTLCTTSADIKAAHTKGQLCSLIGVEGGHSVGSSLPVLRALYEVGVRYLTLTSTCNTPWAECSQVDPMANQKTKPSGLTNFGKSVVKEMNRLGMVVDLSHVSEATMIGALNTSKAPVIFSHSSAYAVCNSTRNVPDRVLKLLAENGGVIMLNFYSQLLSCRETATVQDAVAHLEHVRNVAGAEHIGLGAGYDGINRTPEGLDDASSYPVLFAELLAAGWSEDHLKRLAGLNFLRVLQRVEQVRDELKEAGALPSEDVIAPRLLAPHSNCTSKALF